ncbi:unnamed protein product [Cuscuta campestris]|uniref:EF-hand domain-containing protein n=1 Tax=Cuscuta campestris TaxID=132261 RepID=A0A484KY39_9ASTE|nr:unnamed protein product [Cuscuta campestris]
MNRSFCNFLRKPHNPSPRLICSKSRSISSRSDGGRRFHTRDERKKGGKFLDSLLRSPLLPVVACSSAAGLICHYSLSQKDSLVAFADSGNGASYQPENKPMFIFKDTYRKKVFFKYEKRLRMHSPPEKVFEYFASFRTPAGETYMTPADLMRAVVPVFPPSEAPVVRAGKLKGELVNCELHCAPSKFFMLFDTNNDGLISFPEYIFFVTLLSIPESSFSIAFRMFDTDNDGGIDKEEFKKVMSLMRNQNRQGAHHRDGKRIGLHVSGSVEDAALLEYFFGKDGNAHLDHEKFVQFLRDLHNEILRLEFEHYDYGSRGSISAKDFALSMVVSADMSHIDKFLDRVEELNSATHLKDARFSFDEFKSFAELRNKLHPFSLAIFSYGKSVNGLLTKDDFRRAAKQVCGISLTENMVDLIFYVFDTNRDGILSSDEFLRVLQRRETDISHPRESGLVGMISCWMDCVTKGCSYSKVLR